MLVCDLNAYVVPDKVTSLGRNVSGQSSWVQDLNGYAVPGKATSEEGSKGWDQEVPVESGCVRCSWLSNCGMTLAFGDGSVCRVRDLSGASSSSGHGHALRCDAVVSDLWGCQQSGLLVASLSNATILAWCLTSGAEVLRMKCEAPPSAITGFGSLSNNNLCVVASTTQKGPKGVGGHVHVWSISPRARSSRNGGVSFSAMDCSSNDTLFASSFRGGQTKVGAGEGGMGGLVAAAKGGGGGEGVGAGGGRKRLQALSRFAALEAKLKAEKMNASLLHAVAVQHRINSLWADHSGAMVACATSSGGVIIIRLDDMSCSGPSLRMLARSQNLTQDLSLYMPVLGSTIMDGTLMEWLIARGKDRHLQQLLSVRPSAALMPLACGKSALELATLMRSSQILEQLLLAAVEFVRNGEPAFDAIASPEAAAGGRGGSRVRGGGGGDSQPNLRQNGVENGCRLVPPAMRRVTDCIRIALQSVDMAEVIFRFLRQVKKKSQNKNVYNNNCWRLTRCSPAPLCSLRYNCHF
jgi:hypothetical protein